MIPVRLWSGSVVTCYAVPGTMWTVPRLEEGAVGSALRAWHDGDPSGRPYEREEVKLGVIHCAMVNEQSLDALLAELARAAPLPAGFAKEAGEAVRRPGQLTMW